MRLLGHIINIGEAEGVPYKNIRERILPRSQTFTRFHLGHLAERPDLWQAGAQYLLAAITDGWLDVPIVDRFPLADARAPCTPASKAAASPASCCSTCVRSERDSATPAPGK